MVSGKVHRAFEISIFNEKTWKEMKKMLPAGSSGVNMSDSSFFLHFLCIFQVFLKQPILSAFSTLLG